MPAVAYLSRNLWAKGEITEPKLIILFHPKTTTNMTLSLALFDVNGVQVTDTYTTSIPSGSDKKVVELGDYLNAQQTAKGFGSGIYFIIAKITETNEVWALPLIVTIGYISISQLPDMDYLQYYTVIDLVTGTYFNLPKTIQVLPSDPRFRVYAYYHKEKKGRLIGISEIGSIIFDTGYHQLALITTTLKFNSTSEMLKHMLAHSYGLTDNVALRTLEAIEAGEIQEALKLLKPLYVFTFIGRAIGVEFDTTNYEIKIKSQVYLGQWDWSKILSWGAIGCGVAVATATIVTALTAGIGAISFPLIAGACIAGGALGIGLAVVTSTSSDQPREKIIEYHRIVERTVIDTKTKNEQYHSEATNLLSQWLQQGKITQEDYDKMKKILDDWKTQIDASLDDILLVSKQTIDSAYEEGKEKGREEAKWWIIGAGIGGLAVGILLGRR